MLGWGSGDSLSKKLVSGPTALSEAEIQAAAS